jgi:hypothetical protein
LHLWQCDLSPRYERAQREQRLERATFAGATFDIKAQTSTAFPQQGPFDFLKKQSHSSGATKCQRFIAPTLPIISSTFPAKIKFFFENTKKILNIFSYL